jgi:hypothetical protein
MGCKGSKEIKKNAPPVEEDPMSKVRDSENIDIFIRDERELDVVLYRLRFRNTDPVMKVKQRIMEVANIPLEIQILTFREKKLENETTLFQIGVQENSAIILKTVL